MDDWQELALNNRRIPHGRLGKRGRGGREAEFEPKSAFGTYKFGPAKGKKRAHDDSQGGVLEIHGFDETEQGLCGSFRFGAIKEGVMLFAGSRKVLNSVVEEAENDDRESGTEDEDDGVRAKSVTMSSSNEGASEENGQQPSAENDEEEGEGSGDSQPSIMESQSEDEEARTQRRRTTFQKNSFRSPKFWVRWKGHVKTESGGLTDEENSAYLIFDNNGCKSLSGTITSEILGWKNAAVTGHKIHSKATPSISNWSDFVMNKESA